MEQNDPNKKEHINSQGETSADKNPQKKKEESIKLEVGEEKIEFVVADGRPENFLGFNEASSGDQEQ